MHHIAVPPDADVHKLPCVVWHHMDVYVHLGVLTIGSKQDKEAGPANAQQLLQIGASELALTVTLEQYLDLFVREPPVDLGHGFLLLMIQEPTMPATAPHKLGRPLFSWKESSFQL
jgi:hypothetical protein